MINDNNKAFCPAPWTSLYVEPSGRVDNCCIGSNHLGNIDTDSVEEIVFGRANQQVQTTMLNGQYPPGCVRCENRHHSLQNRMLSMFPDRSVDKYQVGSFDLRYLDARWSNTCNLACVYCNSTLSSTWANELGQMVRLEKNSKTKLLDYVLQNIKLLKEVYLAGGEPLLMKENEYLLAALKEHNPTCKILVNTNLTQIHDNKIFQMLLSLSNTQWLISLDDTDQRFEYLRYPADWATFKNNLKTLANLIDPNSLRINMVFTALNALTIWDAIDWLFQTGFKHSQIIIALYNHGMNKGPLDITSMPVEYQQKVMARLNNSNYDKISGWKDVYSHVSKFKNSNFLDIVSYLKNLDQRRGLDSRRVFPLLYEYKDTK